MTKEEAKNWILEHYGQTLDDGTEHSEVIKFVLKMMEQDPCQNCISRQAVIDVIERWLECSDYNEAERHIMRAVQSVLYDSPSVTPHYTDAEIQKMQELEQAEIQKAYELGKEEKPKMGHWKKMVNVYDTMSGTYIRVPYTNEDKKMGNSPVYECECGCDSNKPTNFCPNCGAKMVESEG